MGCIMVCNSAAFLRTLLGITKQVWELGVSGDEDERTAEEEPNNSGIGRDTHIRLGLQILTIRSMMLKIAMPIFSPGK